MKTFVQKLSHLSLSVNAQTIRIALLTTTLVLFVLSAGAPGCIGGAGG